MWRTAKERAEEVQRVQRLLLEAVDKNSPATAQVDLLVRQRPALTVTLTKATAEGSVIASMIFRTAGRDGRGRRWHR